MVETCADDLWMVGGRCLDLSRRGLIMGILNVTPDSFSDGGHFTDPEQAVAHGLRLVGDGADIIDVGGESTRPGSCEVDAAEEMRRTIPVIRRLRAESGVLISIDTSKAEVAAAALDAGADIINDVAGFRGRGMVELAAAVPRAGLVAMHMQGNPRTMQDFPRYRDVVAEVREFFGQRLEALETAGADIRRVMLDPGIGFGKTVEQNLALLANLGKLRVGGRPLLVGVSRKSFISQVLGDPGMAVREWPTVALTAFARESGAAAVRIHVAAPNKDAMRMAEAITGSG
jgi:dihydropteroate synthase